MAILRLENSPKLYIVGDIHGCYSELEELIWQLGFVKGVHPQGNLLVSVGDFIDRQDKPLEVMELLQDMMAKGSAYAVIGNHDRHLIKYLETGQPDYMHYNFHYVINALERRGSAYANQLLRWLKSLPNHLSFENNGKRLLVMHGDRMQYKNKAIEATNNKDTTLVHGHYALPEPMEWTVPETGLKVVNVDTGCCYMGKLTAYVWPAGEFVSVLNHNRDYSHGVREVAKAQRYPSMCYFGETYAPW